MTEGWTPVSQTTFRCLAGFPPPEDVAAKRLLLLAIVEGRLRHKGQLRQLSSPNPNEKDPITIVLEPAYRAPPDLWSAERVCFTKSELYLGQTPVTLGSQRIEGNFKVTQILVPADDVLGLCWLPPQSSGGGRPMKKAIIQACEYICAHIHRVGLPQRHVELVEATLEHIEQLPKEERIGRTTVETLVRGHLKAIDGFDS